GERYELRFRSLDGGTDPADVVPDVYYGVAWANDGRTVFFTRPDEAMRPWQVWRHRLGTDPDHDELVYQEDADRSFVPVARARTGRVVVITAASKVTTEVRLIDADAPDEPPRLVEPRVHGHEYHVEPHDGPSGTRNLFVLTNADGAENFALMVTPLDAPSHEHWPTVRPHRADVRLDDVDAFMAHAVVSERAEGLERLRVLDLDVSGAVTRDHVVATDEEVGSTWMGGNPEYDTAIVRFGYTSLVTPSSSFDYDVRARTSTLVKQQPVAGYESARYATERLWATAPDGTRVPVSIVYRRDLRRADGNPLLLYGYGAYEASIDPAFSSARVNLVDRGVVYAIAHVRGGGELGREWYEQGKLREKPNTFTDFIAAAEFLIASACT